MMDKLKYFEFVPSITTIGIQAFYKANLLNRDLSGCTGLTKIESGAFNQSLGYDKTASRTLIMPSSLRVIAGGLNFGYLTAGMGKDTIDTIQFGGPHDPWQITRTIDEQHEIRTDIGASAFQGNEGIAIVAYTTDTQGTHTV